MDPGIRQRGPGRGLASVLGQAKAVRAVGEHVHGVGNTAGRERRGEAVGVFGGDVGVRCGVPDEKRRRRGRDQRIQRCRPAQPRAGVLAEEDQPGGTVGLGLHRGDGVTKDSELHRLIGRGAWREGGQPGQMASRGEPHEPDALRASGPPAADLSAQRVQRRRVPDVERIAEHARLHAQLAEPAGHRLGFVRCVFGIPAAGQHDHVRRTCRRHSRILRFWRKARLGAHRE